MPFDRRLYPALQVAYDDNDNHDDDEDEEDEDEEEEEEEERETREYINVIESPRVPQCEDGEERSHQESEGRGEVVCSTSGSQENGETEGLSCPICMEAWTSGGEHHVWYS